MPTIYIRNFPENVHRALKLEAVKQKKTLQAIMIEAARLWLKAKAKK